MGQIAFYIRVSTEDQDWGRQLRKCNDYTDRKWDTPIGDRDVYRDKSTGTNTERAEYQELMADASEYDAVVVSSISRISRSIRDLDRTVDILKRKGTELHIIDEGLEIRPEDDDPFQRAMLQLLGVFAELEAAMGQQRTKEGIAARQQDPEYHHGRPPLGFEKDDGRLIEADNYDQVVTVLEMVQGGHLSKRKAAAELDTTRSTIRSALDRSDLYGL